MVETLTPLSHAMLISLSFKIGRQVMTTVWSSSSVKKKWLPDHDKQHFTQQDIPPGPAGKHTSAFPLMVFKNNGKIMNLKNKKTKNKKNPVSIKINPVLTTKTSLTDCRPTVVCQIYPPTNFFNLLWFWHSFGQAVVTVNSSTASKWRMSPQRKATNSHPPSSKHWIPACTSVACFENISFGNEEMRSNPSSDHREGVSGIDLSVVMF